MSIFDKKTIMLMHYINELVKKIRYGVVPFSKNLDVPDLIRNIVYDESSETNIKKGIKCYNIVESVNQHDMVSYYELFGERFKLFYYEDVDGYLINFKVDDNFYIDIDELGWRISAC